MYALDDDSRMMVFTRIGNEFRREDSPTDRSMTGLSIVSNSGKFRSTSTVYHRSPRTARHGYLYFVGNHVRSEDGEAGNPAVIRYRFKPPEVADR